MGAAETDGTSTESPAPDAIPSMSDEELAEADDLWIVIDPWTRRFLGNRAPEAARPRTSEVRSISRIVEDVTASLGRRSAERSDMAAAGYRLRRVAPRSRAQGGT